MYLFQRFQSTVLSLKKKSLLKGVALHFCINLSGLKETTQYSVSLSDSK